MLQVYSLFNAVIDGALQAEQCKVRFEHECGQPARVEVTYCVPQSGLEFDPRPHLGTDRTFQVNIIGSGGMGQCFLREVTARVVGIKGSYSTEGDAVKGRPDILDRDDGVARFTAVFEEVAKTPIPSNEAGT